MLLSEEELTKTLSSRVNLLLDINRMSITEVARVVHPNDEQAVNSFRGTLSHIKSGERGLPSYYNLYKLFVALPGLTVRDIFKLSTPYSATEAVRSVSEPPASYGMEKQVWMQEKIELLETLNKQHTELRQCYARIKQLESELSDTKKSS